MHRLAYLRMIGTRAILAREVAKLIASSSLAEGDRLFDAGDDAPGGDGLGERITRARYEKRDAQRQQEWERDLTFDPEAARATELAFAALRGIPE